MKEVKQLPNQVQMGVVLSNMVDLTEDDDDAKEITITPATETANGEPVVSQQRSLLNNIVVNVVPSYDDKVELENDADDLFGDYDKPTDGDGGQPTTQNAATLHGIAQDPNINDNDQPPVATDDFDRLYPLANPGDVQLAQLQAAQHGQIQAAAQRQQQQPVNNGAVANNQAPPAPIANGNPQQGWCEWGWNGFSGTVSGVWNGLPGEKTWQKVAVIAFGVGAVGVAGAAIGVTTTTIICMNKKGGSQGGFLPTIPFALKGCKIQSDADIDSNDLTKYPTKYPTEGPTEDPPTKDPTKGPTEVPTEDPPTKGPTEVPTEDPPTKGPTKDPTEVPSKDPTEVPSKDPTEVPSKDPTEVPSRSPTEAPSENLTEAPSENLTEAPSIAEQPTTQEPTCPPLGGTNNTHWCDD